MLTPAVSLGQQNPGGLLVRLRTQAPSLAVVVRRWPWYRARNGHGAATAELPLTGRGRIRKAGAILSQSCGTDVVRSIDARRGYCRAQHGRPTRRTRTRHPRHAAAGSTAGQQPRRRRDRRTEDPRRDRPRRNHRHHPRHRHPIPRLRPRPATHQGRPDRHEADRPVQSPQTGTGRRPSRSQVESE